LLNCFSKGYVGASYFDGYNVVDAIRLLRNVFLVLQDRWVSRSIDDYLYKADIVTYKSVTRIEGDSCMDGKFCTSIHGNLSQCGVIQLTNAFL